MNTRCPLLSSRVRKIQLLMLTAGHLLVDMYAGFLTPLMPHLRDRLGVSISALAMVVGVSQVLVNAIQPLSGPVAVRLRRPVLLLIGPIVAAGMTLVGFVGSLPALVALMIVAHVGIGVFHPDGLMTAQTISGSKGHLGVPLFLSGGYLGFSLGALASTQWLDHFGFQGFWLMAAPAVVLTVGFVATGLYRQDLRVEGPTTSVAVGSGPNFWMLLLLSTLSVMMTCVVFMFLCVHFDDLWGDYGRSLGGMVLAVFGFGGAAASFGWGRLSARYSRFALVAVGHLACVPLFLAFLQVGQGYGLVTLLSFPLGACLGSALFPVIATAARECSQLNLRLRAGLILGGTWGVGSAFSAGVGQLTRFGVTPEQFLPWMIIPTILAAGFAVWMYAAERRRDRATGESVTDD